MWWLRARHTSHCTQDYKEPACLFWSEKNQASPSIDFLYFHALLACWVVVSSLQWLHLDSSLTELFCSGLAKACPCGDLSGPRDKREAPRSPRTLISYIQAISHRPTILKQQKKKQMLPVTGSEGLHDHIAKLWFQGELWPILQIIYCTILINSCTVDI